MVTFTNPFVWGVCIISDSGMQDVPTLTGDSAKTSTAIIVPVHDPTQPTLADVTVRCHEEPAPGKVRVEGVIDVPTRKLVIGDANGERSFEIPTGRVLIQVTAIPWGEASSIDIWIVPQPSRF